MCGRRVRLTPSLPSASKLPRKRRNLNILKAYGPTRPITGITLQILPFLLIDSLLFYLYIYAWFPLPHTQLKTFVILKHTERIYVYSDATYSGSVVEGAKYFRPLKHWDRVFKTHSRYWCLRFSVWLFLCVGSGLATGLIIRPSSPTNCLYKSTVSD
jgi:hypothetical protein